LTAHKQQQFAHHCSRQGAFYCLLYSTEILAAFAVL